MSKVALISDLHFGARNDNPVLLEHTKKFLEVQFFPFLRKNGIRDVFVLGDVFDRRKYINIATLNFVRKSFIEKLHNNYVYFITGNHDVYHTNSLGVNSIDELMQSREGLKFSIITEPTEMKFTWAKILFLPWICLENEKRSLELIDKTDAKVCFGHLELKGFESHAGYIIDRGLDISLFSKFGLVASGHIHKRQTNGNVSYLGSPFQITWADYDSPKGFHTLDTETLQLEFVRNPKEMYHKIVYDDHGQTLEQVLNWDFDTFQDCYVKVLVLAKTNPYHFDMFIDTLEKYAMDVKIIEDKIMSEAAIQTFDGQPENTMAIIRKFVEESNVQVDKNRLDKLMTDLYNGAMMVE